MRLTLCEAPVLETRPDHHTGNSVPYSLRQVRGFFNVPCGLNTEDAGDGAYGLSSLSEKTRTSNHLQMSLQRQHVLLSYFKTPSVGPRVGLEPETFRTAVRRSTNWANRSPEKRDFTVLLRKFAFRLLCQHKLIYQKIFKPSCLCKIQSMVPGKMYHWHHILLVYVEHTWQNLFHDKEACLELPNKYTIVLYCLSVLVKLTDQSNDTKIKRFDFNDS